MLRNRETDRARQFVAVALDEVLEGLVNVKLRINILRNGGIEHAWGLVDACRRFGRFNTYWLIALYVLRKIVGLVSDDAIGQADVFTKTAGKHLAEKSNVVLFQILVDVRAWNLHQQRLVLFREGLEDDGLKPRFKLLL